MIEDPFYHEAVPDFDWKYHEFRTYELLTRIGYNFPDPAIAKVTLPYANQCIRLWKSDIENRYLSTHKGGSGIGLLSVAATAARYDGTATFTHDGTIFYSDVVLKTIASAKEDLLH